MGIDKIIMIIMMIFFTLGAIDRCIGNKFQLGKEYERGWGILAPTALVVLGLMSIAPVVAIIIRPVIVPIYTFLGADPAMFSGTFFSPDCGGYSIGADLANDPEIAAFGGFVVGATIGAVVSFTIPFAYGLIDKEDTKYFSVGIMSGFIFDPVACFIGGLVMGLKPIVILQNLVPVIISALAIVVGLYFIPRILIKVFKYFSNFLLIIITIGLVNGAIEQMTGFAIIQGTRPISEAFIILSNIILVIAGALPFLHVFRKIFNKPINRISEKMGITELTLATMILSLTSIAPLYTEYGKFNIKGKVIAAGFTASMSNMFGAHLGFISAIDSTYIGPMIVAKCVAGAFAIPTAIFFYNRLFGKKSNNYSPENAEIQVPESNN